MTDITFKSYYWSVGTTSFRTENFNYKIENQLKILNEFRNKYENSNEEWSGNNNLQKRYYLYMNKLGFLKKADAKRPDKDARQKTSGLVDIGLIDDERRLTEAGKALLDISESNDFRSDNFLEIPKDSFIYFKQLLKTDVEIENKTVRPFIIFLYMILKKEFLTYEEFTYLLPLCIDKASTAYISEMIDELRKGEITCDDIIVKTFLKMPNYQAGLDLIRKNPVTEELICTVGMNRKSRSYDRPYFAMYETLRRIVFEKEDLAMELYDNISRIANTASLWRRFLFKKSARRYIEKNGMNSLNRVPILQIDNIEEFNEEFFKLLHLFRAKKNLSDYFDLNRRYFKITDTVIFEDGKVELDLLPQCYLEGMEEMLLPAAFNKCKKLDKNCPLEEIGSFLKPDVNLIYNNLSLHIGEDVDSSSAAKQIIKTQKYLRFNKLIDKKFSKENLILLLDHFEERNDQEIKRMVTDNADIPTIFEYILAVIWYIISGRKGEVLEYMKLSLEADLLPKTHAKGGEADIVWEYQGCSAYPAHTLLIEATLSDRTNQRRMEMEPVSRHLGEYCLLYKEKKAYSIFIATFLHLNVISDFRGRQNSIYYSASGDDQIFGLKIIPLQTDLLKIILKKDISYSRIYNILDAAYYNEDPPKQWYEGLCDEIFKF